MKREFTNLAKTAAVLSAMALAATFVYYRTTGTLPWGGRIADLFGYQAEAAAPAQTASDSSAALAAESRASQLPMMLPGSKSSKVQLYDGSQEFVTDTTTPPELTATSSASPPNFAQTKAKEWYVRAQTFFPWQPSDPISSSKWTSIARPSDFRVDTASGTIILATPETETVPLPSERQMFSSSKGGVLLIPRDLQPQSVPKGAHATQIFVPQLSQPTSTIDTRLMLQGVGIASPKSRFDDSVPVGPPEAKHFLYFPSLPVSENEETEPSAELTPERIERLGRALREVEQERPKP